MNNPYVTKKTTRPRPWQGAILGICGFFTIVIGSMVPDYVTKKGAIDTECYLHCCLAVLRRSCWL